MRGQRPWMVWLLGLLALPALALAAGCTRSSQASPQRGTAVVAFVDFSASVGGPAIVSSSPPSTTRH